MIAALVETKDLLETVAASLIAGVGVTVTFSVMIFGAVRQADLRRDDRPALATAAGALAVLALVVTLAGIGVGITVMLSK